MTIWRGEGGGGDATTDSEINFITSLTNSIVADTALTTANAAASAASALAAATSESNAAASEIAAASSASAASASAISADASANSAANSYDSFDDRYLGSKTVAPTLDNDGNALLVGALYWNSVTTKLFVWSGTAWRDGFFTGLSSSLVTATAGQTVVTTPTYVVGTNTIQVYVNGLKVILGTDFTETSTTSITFSSGLTLGDEVEIVVVQSLTIGTAAASNVSYTPTGTIAAANVQDALSELSSEKVQSTVLAASGGASLVGNTPSGTIAATTVQGAINEIVSDLAASNGSSLVGYLPSGTGALASTVQTKLQSSVSVKDFGAVGNGIADDSTAVQNAVNTGKRVYFPSGTYLCNVTVANKIILEGDGSTVSIIKPYSVGTAAITYTSIGNYWSYHSEVRGIGFQGIGTKTGVGFTFGATTQAGHFTNAQYVNNVKFYGCKFTNLEKGVQFPFGNIGSEFYSCGFQSNKYGVYSIDNKAGGDIMHAGNKYFFAGEFSGNECAFYLHNVTDGFGAVSFSNTIFEYNLVSAYIYGTKCFTPIKFDGVWFEGNGQNSPGAATVTIDSWSGSTRSDQTLTKRNFILEGSNTSYCFDKCFLTDIYIKGTYTTVIGNDCRVEVTSGNSGNPCTVDNPANCAVRLSNPYTDGGLKGADGVISSGAVRPLRYSIAANATDAGSRWFITQQRSSKVASYGPSRAMSSPLTSVATTSGSFVLTGTVVSDGVLYASCNQFTRATFGTGEFVNVNSPNTSITTSAGWYVFTLDFKRIAGNPSINVWDRNTAQFIQNATAPALNNWYTFAAIGYSAGSQSLFLDFRGDGTTCTWNVSAYQIHRFDTLDQAQSFLMSGVFAES